MVAITLNAQTPARKTVQTPSFDFLYMYKAGFKLVALIVRYCAQCNNMDLSGLLSYSGKTNIEKVNKLYLQLLIRSLDMTSVHFTIVYFYNPRLPYKQIASK